MGSGEARFITEMRLLLRTLRSLDPAFCKSVNLNIHDVQFQLCEYDKYCRVGDGGHVYPYRPHVSMNIPDLPARPHPHHALLGKVLKTLASLVEVEPGLDV